MGLAPFVLIVDDDPDISTMLKILLSRNGFSVAIATRVEQMAEILRSNTVNLFVLDMLLGGSNGLDICKKLKEDDQTSHIPLIMISGHADAKVAALESGADDFLPKPFNIADFLAKVTVLINQEHIM